MGCGSGLGFGKRMPSSAKGESLTIIVGYGVRAGLQRKARGVRWVCRKDGEYMEAERDARQHVGSRFRGPLHSAVSKSYYKHTASGQS